MNAYLLLFVDSGGIANHWVDAAFAALIALVGYFGRSRFSDMERRHERAENKFEEVDKDLHGLDVRVVRLEEDSPKRKGR